MKRPIKPVQNGAEGVLRGSGLPGHAYAGPATVNVVGRKRKGIPKTLAGIQGQETNSCP